jgi:hypothetical protein
MFGSICLLMTLVEASISDVIADVTPTIHQHSPQRTNTSNVIKPSIIIQTHNSTNQGIAKGTTLPVVK